MCIGSVSCTTKQSISTHTGNPFFLILGATEMECFCDGLCNNGDCCTINHLGDCEAHGCLDKPLPVDCHDNNPCTKDMCDPAYSCMHTPIKGLCSGEDQTCHPTGDRVGTYRAWHARAQNATPILAVGLRSHNQHRNTHECADNLSQDE
jgi:hypothetical protein